MRQVLLAALLFVQSQVGVAPAPTAGSQVTSAATYPRFQPKATGPFSLDLNESTRTAFETVAAKAGISIIFDKDWRPLPPTITLKMNDVGIYEALDLITMASNTFWMPVGTQTIFVADNNVQRHRDFDLQRLEVIGVDTPQRINDILNPVLRPLGLRSYLGVAGSKAIIVNDAPAKVALARQKIAELVQGGTIGAATTAYETDAIGNVYVLDGSGRNINPARSRLQLKSAGSFSIDINQATRGAFEAIAAKAGITIIFDRSWRPAPTTTSLKLNDVDVYEALDLLSISTNTFWVPIGSHTIFVTDNNNQKRRDYDSSMIKVIHLAGPKTPQELSDVMNALRQALNIVSIVTVPQTNSLILKDRPARVALAEMVIADLDGRMNGASAARTVATYETDAPGNVVVLDGSSRNINPARSQLQPTSTGPFSFDLNQPTPNAFETIAAKAGLSVVFDRDWRPQPTITTQKLNDIDIYSALDMMSLMTGTSWLPLGSQSIFVLDNNTQKHRDFDPLKTVVMDLPGTKSPQDLNDIMNVLRQVVNLTNIYSVPSTNSLVFSDTPARVALAQRLIVDLDPSSPAPILELDMESLGTLTNPLSSGLSRYAGPPKSVLQPTANASFSLNMNEDARRAFEILGETGGLNVVFAPGFIPGTLMAFHLDKVDMIQALDLLSSQTGNYWQVVDSKTIRVSPEYRPGMQSNEPLILKTFQIKNSALLDNIGAALRGILFIRDLKPDPASNTIDVRTTSNNLTLAEKLITALDRPAPAK